MLLFHGASYVKENSVTISWLVTDIILAMIFFIFYKVEKIKVEIVFSFLLFGWSMYAISFKDINPALYSLVFAYSIMLFLKEVKVTIFKVSLLIILYTSVSLVIYRINDAPMFMLYGSFFVTLLFGVAHYMFYYSTYKELPDIKTKYNLTTQEMLIIQCLFKADPSNRHIASQLILSESTIKADLGIIYKKLNILSGGSKKAELVSKLAIEGFTLS
jgi:DNA-binding CsgD family transcriptional regulator